MYLQSDHLNPEYFLKQERLKKEKKEFVKEMGDAKDDFMIELVRKYQDGLIQEDFEAEKERRLCLYDEMTDSDQVTISGRKTGINKIAFRNDISNVSF